jgi:hypothetical protein
VNRIVVEWKQTKFCGVSRALGARHRRSNEPFSLSLWRPKRVALIRFQIRSGYVIEHSAKCGGIYEGWNGNSICRDFGTFISLTVVAVWLPLMFLLLSSNLGPGIGHPDWGISWFFSGPPSKWQGPLSSTFFPFTNHRIIFWCIVLLEVSLSKK